MKAIILAGGLGTRLGKYTKNLPKCMLNFLGKTLIERGVEIFRKCGVTDIIVTRKHLKEKINLSDVGYDDKEADETNMLDDFFHARKEFDEDIILCYGDIVFEEEVVKKLIDSRADISVVADVDWKGYWEARLGDWKKDSESFVFEENKIISLGISNPPEDKMHARYVGLIKFSKKILQKIIDIYDENAKKYWEKPWHTSKSFKKAYMTDFLQELINRGFDVRVVKINKGWLEFDTEKDYELAQKWAEEDTLKKFIKVT